MIGVLETDHLPLRGHSAPARSAERIPAQPQAGASVTVTLAADGRLLAQLVGPTGAVSWVPLYDLEALAGILEGQLAGQLALGLDGSPTAAEALHNAKHGASPDPRCAFCRRFAAAQTGALAIALQTSPSARPRFVASGDVRVRRLPLGASGLEAPAPRAVASRFDHPPAGASRRELAQWKVERERWLRETEDRVLRKQGRSRMLKAEDLGL